MDEIIADFKAVEVSKLQKVLAIVALILVVLANTNIRQSDYSAYVREGTTTNLYFMTVFTSGDAVSVGMLGQFIRLK